MKTLFAVAVAGVAFATSALAEPVRIELIKSPIALEMYAAEGDALVNLNKGIVKLQVCGLPENRRTRTPEGANITDGSEDPRVVKAAVEYHVWLLRVEARNDHFVITDGLHVGELNVGRRECGKLHHDGKRIPGDYNVIAVTAEEEEGVSQWIPGDEWIHAFTWNRSPNGMIIMWGEIEPFPSMNAEE